MFKLWFWYRYYQAQYGLPWWTRVLMTIHQLRMERK